MIQFKKQLCVILMGSTLAMGLQAMESQPESLAAYLTSFLYNPKTIHEQVLDVFIPRSEAITLGLHIKNHFALLKKDTSRWQETIAIRDMLLDDDKKGTLSSIGNVELASADSITMYLIYDPDVALKHYEALENQTNKLISAISDGNVKKFWQLTEKRRYYSNVKAAVLLIKNNLDGYMWRENKSNKPNIALSNSLQPVALYYSSVFHEIAHVFDARLKNERACWDDYPWLGEDVQDFDTWSNKGVNYSEWHAEKQAISWLKKYKPEQVLPLIQHYEDLVSSKAQNYSVPKYPPYSVKLKWLRDPNV